MQTRPNQGGTAECAETPSSLFGTKVFLCLVFVSVIVFDVRGVSRQSER